ncbi:MAG: serine/threonine protein kinase [Planctomycetaceae bacterium]|nr:serine/threonine protein kinase [Planctomycetaceae bacterium]
MIHSQETIGWEGPGEPRPPDWPKVPGYEVLRELGRGGMGVVYRARQVSDGRLVALKLIRDGALAGEQDRARFRLEAEAAARMQHPNVVQIFEVGEHNGLPFFAMELIEGGSLDTHLAGQPMSPRQAAELVLALAEAIEHAHARKIVHRDLKPANVLMRRSGVASGGVVSGESASLPLTTHHSPLTPKIADFGLAKRLDGESTAWTQAGAVLGTAAYMAPEQAEGRVGAIGPAADIYSLGAILYELLAGRPPFVNESWGQTVWQVLHVEPTPPSLLAPDVPGDLDSICLTCLEKEPARRYASARALADDLRRFLDEQPVAATPLSGHERLVRLAERDGYRLGDEIGRGPRSVVYRAVYEPLKQTVAVKVFAADLCPREAWEERLAAGAALWASLAHPQIATVQRAGWWNASGYVVMDYVPQGSLAERMAQHCSPHAPREGSGASSRAGEAAEPRSVTRSVTPTMKRPRINQALDLVVQLAELANYLHRQGIVHGNLKPSNVLLAADGIPRVSDFRLTGGLFQQPALLGKPAVAPDATPAGDDDPAGLCYLAPELLDDSAAEPRPYTDIYGLGLILYELLAGRPPFVGGTASEVAEQVRSQDPAPPSQWNKEVTPSLDAVCLRCLRKNPWRRYYRVYDLLTRLRYLRDNPGGELAPGQWWLRRRGPVRDDTS